MNVVEVVLAVVFAALGVRSLVHWIRVPFDGIDVADHVLYAAFVTGRVGLWFGLSGLFFLYALTETRGRAFVDDVRSFDWLAIVFIVLSAMQLFAGYLLSRRSSE